ncbi:hypothetical protein [Propionispora vibrioides]|uniref:Uracil DNA glycosylase superfamily protein n=1 Tax=Propionispora vibrioides TaxID=112903 RepID=A0A1H8R057_9FIRM|nr:hypothetical protein [Propionispora vibrioides]SEO59969.1 hypothetical protein SAMN04490178_103124 [Propionispora vibrioides]
MAKVMDSRIEEIRLGFKPDIVRVLLVGESAPVAGTFFYTGDSLCKYTQTAFANVFPAMRAKRWQEFLSFFQQSGFYLDDLCLIPVNGMDKASRQQNLINSIPSLALRIEKYAPSHIIILLKGIEKYVLQAVNLSGVRAHLYTVPFGGMGHQNKYIDEMSTIISALIKP